MTTLSLYEIGAEFARLEAALVASEGEMSEEVAAAMDALGTMEAAKVDGYRHIVLRFEKYAAHCDDEATVLKAKADAARNAAKRLMERLHEYMVAKGVTELQGDIFKAAITANGGKEPLTVLVPVENLDRKWCRITVAPDPEKLRAAAVNGEVRDEAGGLVAKLEPRGTHLRFR